MKKLMDLVIKGKYYLDQFVKNKRLFFTVIGVLAVLLLININSVQRSRIPVKTYKAAKGDIVVTVSAPGIVKATTAQMAARTPGRVAWVGVTEGDEVKKGDILIKLDSYDNVLKEYQRIKSLYNKGFASSQQLENARYNLDGASIKSPIDGTVSNVAVELGESAIIGDPIVTVTSSKGMSIEIQIDQVDVGSVKRGNEVRVMTDAYPDETFTGKLEWINTEAEQKMIGGVPSTDEDDKIFRGKVKLNNETIKLYPNMSVDTEIVVQRMNDVMLVPREAVASENGKFYVYVVKWDHVEKKQIKLGLKDNYNVEITDGIKLGTVVAVSNVIKLKNGTKIKIDRK
jgi:RND family efflux transporter MFP subunit